MIADDEDRLQEILNRILDGRSLGRQEAYALINSPSYLLPRLCVAAGAVRDREKGRRVTYSPKVFAPLTNLCRNACTYCTFYKVPGQPGAKTMKPEEVLALAKEGERHGCKEILFSLGEKPELLFPEARDELRGLGYSRIMEYLRDACELVVRKSSLLPHANPGTMSRKDLEELRPVNASMGMMLENVSERLMGPGGAHEFAPDKHPKVRLATIRNAGILKIPFTTGILIGIGETRQERIDSLFALKELHDQYDHIQEIIIQNFRAKPDTPMRNRPEPDESEMVRTIAVARFIFRGSLNIQAPPNLAPTSWRAYLQSGINDWGGVSPVTKDYINPEMPWPQLAKLKEETELAGFIFRERLAIYPEYITRKDGFVSEELKERVTSYVDENGYVKEELEIC